MNATKQRTPGPWIHGDLPNYGADTAIYALTKVHKNPKTVGRVYGEGIFSKDTSERDANAAFIVEACNNYERVCAARDELAKALRKIEVAAVTPDDATGALHYVQIARIARAALTKL